MAKIVEPPKPKKVTCNACGAVMEYMPEEVQRHDGRDHSGGPDGYERVKCPRAGCPGHGYIRRW